MRGCGQERRQARASLGADNRSPMKTTPLLMLFGAISSAMFADSSVKPHIARLGKICVAIFSVLFAISEVWSLLN